MWLADLHEGRAEGMIGESRLIADAQVGDSGIWGDVIPVRVEASFDRVRLGLAGWIYQGGIGFDHARVDGDFAGRPVTAFITGGEPADDAGIFAAHGLFADSDFTLRGHVFCGGDAVIEGSVSGQPVDLRIEARSGRDARDVVTGSYSGPGPLLLVVLACALYFL